MSPLPAHLRHRRINSHAGKTNFELACIATGKYGPVGGFVHVVTRPEIECCDISRFLRTFSHRRSRQQLQEMQGSVMFTVEGYDHTEEPLFAIPEVRTFFTACHKRWPCWLALAELRSDCLAMVACSVLPNLRSIQRKGKKADIIIQRADLVDFFHDGLGAAADLHCKVGITEARGKKMLKSVLKYLGLEEK